MYNQKHTLKIFLCKGYFVDNVGKNAKKIEEYIDMITCEHVKNTSNQTL